MTNDLFITMKDVRKQKWCAKGAREFCKKHDLSWDELRTVGLSAKVLLATNDAFAIKVVEAVKKENQ